jgi:hypothetical protein
MRAQRHRGAAVGAARERALGRLAVLDPFDQRTEQVEASYALPPWQCIMPGIM